MMVLRSLFPGRSRACTHSREGWLAAIFQIVLRCRGAHCCSQAARLPRRKLLGRTHGRDKQVRCVRLKSSAQACVLLLYWCVLFWRTWCFLVYRMRMLIFPRLSYVHADAVYARRYRCDNCDELRDAQKWESISKRVKKHNKTPNDSILHVLSGTGCSLTPPHIHTHCRTHARAPYEAGSPCTYVC